MCAQTRPRFLYSHPKEFWGKWSQNLYVTSKGKIPSTGKIFLRGGSNPRRCIKQDSKPNTLPTELFRPQMLIVYASGPKKLTKQTRNLIYCTTPFKRLTHFGYDSLSNRCSASSRFFSALFARLRGLHNRIATKRGT